MPSVEFCKDGLYVRVIREREPPTFALAIVDDHAIRRAVFPCSIDQLLAPLEGLTFQTSNADGYVAIRLSNGDVALDFGLTDARESRCTVPQHDYRESLLSLSDAFDMAKTAHSISIVSFEQAPTILLVEDSPDEEMLTLRALRQNRFSGQVLVAHTTEQAFYYLFSPGPAARSVPPPPDVIVTDLKIASIGGASLVSAIRGHSLTHLIPIVVFSGSASATDLNDLYNRGVNSFLEKPINFEDFASTIATIATYWGILNTNVTNQAHVSGFRYTL
jgi:two-component system response regulator